VDRSVYRSTSKNRSHIVGSALRYLGRGHKTFDLRGLDVDAVVQEFSDFVDSQTVRLLTDEELEVWTEATRRPYPAIELQEVMVVGRELHSRFLAPVLLLRSHLRRLHGQPR